ncbi:MAG TPA: hydroxymethylbilane synthase [Chthoniobacterales bacterium]|nr:hydroxymethylbilane synthase [Chthoniobacterales bacterium]
MGAPGRIILGSRGSDLALAQTRLVERALQAAWPELEVAIEVIRTRGDEEPKTELLADRKAGRKGMFTREIEQALLVRRIDVAVHSAKDLPSEPREELELGATPPRGAAEDVLITKTGDGLATIPAGSVIATGSVRRQHQLVWKRPDLQTADLRGNVPTRLRKLRENESWSGVILARVGLERLGLAVQGEILSPDDFVPAGGQGVIALQVRRADAKTRRWIDPVNDRATLTCLRAEREFLRLLGGDCDSPVGVQALLNEGELVLRAQIFEGQTAAPRVGTTTGSAADPEAIAAQLMKQLYGG